MAVLESRDLLTEEFLRYLAIERNTSPLTVKAYRQALEGFRATSKTPWKKCSAEDFRDYLFTIMKRGQARTYVRLQFSALRTFYRFLVQRKNLKRDPLRELQLPKIDIYSTQRSAQSKAEVEMRDWGSERAYARIPYPALQIHLPPAQQKHNRLAFPFASSRCAP